MLKNIYICDICKFSQENCKFEGVSHTKNIIGISFLNRINHVCKKCMERLFLKLEEEIENIKKEGELNNE